MFLFTFSTPPSATNVGARSVGDLERDRLASRRTATVFDGSNVPATCQARMRREKLSMTAWM
jgi:hypothetical protein